MPIIFEAEKKGRGSIQINSLKSHLSNHKFKSRQEIQRYFPEVKWANKKMFTECKIYTVMDLDDATANEQFAYKNGQMFGSYWFKESVFPIYNAPNLEDVLKAMNYTYAKK